eukprot:tig00020563_g11262.t1
MAAPTMLFFGAFSTRTLALRPAAAAARRGPFCKLVSTRAIFTSAPRNHSPDEAIDHILDIENALAAENPQERARRLSKSIFASAQHTTRELLDAVRGLQTSMNNMASEVGSIKTEVGSVKTEVGSMKTEIGGLNNKIGAEVGSMKTEIGGLNNKIGAEVGSMKTEIGGLDNKIGGLDNKIGAMKVEVEAVKSKIGMAVTLWQILAFVITLLSALFSVQSGLVSISIPRKAGAGGEGPQ